MLPQAGKEFLVRLRSSCGMLFHGRYLLLINSLGGGGMMAFADVLEQTWEIRKEPDQLRDWSRTGRTFVVGCSVGPLLHYWYYWLDRVYVGKALNTVGKKILADQLIGSPVVGMGYFLGMDVMEGHTLSEGWEELKNKFLELYKTSWFVWPPAQMINFCFLSPKFRVLYINSVSLGWDTYLSYLKHRDDSQHTGGDDINV
ncbi:mpv17-like protein 2 [Anabas testudineus]|uniref:mpv17-like protein 2 n=1 Tax=Anabas testudineus TaxID=64144 RepID=UPI000E459CB9|nr:mpv17-like protein 2 [Anabas testudineus]